MYVLTHVIVAGELDGAGVVLEGVTLANQPHFITVLIGADGTMIGTEDTVNNKRVLAWNECMKIVGIVNPPKNVLGAERIEDTEFYRMPMLHKWFVHTFGVGCREFATDETISYA